jgi:hypothetical protein
MLSGQGIDIECQASPQPSSDDLDGQVLLFNVLAPSAMYSYLCLLLAKFMATQTGNPTGEVIHQNYRTQAIRQKRAAQQHATASRVQSTEKVCKW